MRACPSPALAETVTSVATLGRGPLGRCRTALGTRDSFALAVNIRPVVRTFRLRFLLMLSWRLRGWLRGLREERSEQHSREHHDRHQSAHKISLLYPRA